MPTIACRGLACTRTLQYSVGSQGGFWVADEEQLSSNLWRRVLAAVAVAAGVGGVAAAGDVSRQYSDVSCQGEEKREKSEDSANIQREDSRAMWSNRDRPSELVVVCGWCYKRVTLVCVTALRYAEIPRKYECLNSLCPTDIPTTISKLELGVQPT